MANDREHRDRDARTRAANAADAKQPGRTTRITEDSAEGGYTAPSPLARFAQPSAIARTDAFSVRVRGRTAALDDDITLVFKSQRGRVVKRVRLDEDAVVELDEIVDADAAEPVELVVTLGDPVIAEASVPCDGLDHTVELAGHEVVLTARPRA